MGAKWYLGWQNRGLQSAQTQRLRQEWKTSFRARNTINPVGSENATVSISSIETFNRGTVQLIFVFDASALIPKSTIILPNSLLN